MKRTIVSAKKQVILSRVFMICFDLLGLIKIDYSVKRYRTPSNWSTLMLQRNAATFLLGFFDLKGQAVIGKNP